MYNRNGIILLNTALTASSSGTSSEYISTSIVGGDTPIVDLNGNPNTTVYLLSESSVNVANILAAVKKLSIVGFGGACTIPSSVGYVTSATNSFAFIGYRASNFTELTFTLPDTTYQSLCSRTVTKGIPTITVNNTTSSNIVINEICIVARFYTSSPPPSGNFNAVIAGFHFADITIASGETYTFTIMHKNS